MELPYKADFTGKVAVVTGAGGILCSSMSKALASAGAKVALLDINEESIKKVAEEIEKDGGTAIPVRCNILDKDEVKKAHELILKTFGKTNILLNGAGGNNPRATVDSEVFKPDQLGKEKTFFDIDEESFRFVFDINFTGEFIMVPLTKIPAYSAAKASVYNFTQWLAMYFSDVGIRVNAIAPGFLLTHQTKPLFYQKDGITPTPRLNKIIAGTPMHRLGEPEELIGSVLFLLDEKASGFITGAILPIDGGYTAYSGV